MIWWIIGSIAFALFALLCFAFGIRDAVLMVYFTIKSVVLHLLEWIVYVIFAFIHALFRFDIAVFGILVICFITFAGMDRNVNVVLGLVFAALLIRNFVGIVREYFYYKPFREFFTLIDKLLSFGEPELYCFEETQWR